ncbi:hypothetical protein Tco_0128837 [Tanacetum coccineum]
MNINLIPGKITRIIDASKASQDNLASVSHLMNLYDACATNAVSKQHIGADQANRCPQTRSIANRTSVSTISSHKSVISYPTSRLDQFPDLPTIVAYKHRSALRPPTGLAAAADELSPTSYLGPRAIPNLFRGGLIGPRGGGIPDDGASDLVGESMNGGGNGREWEVDAASALIRIIAA